MAVLSCRRLQPVKPLRQDVQAPPAARRRVILLVQAGKPVDATIANLLQHLEKGDIIIDGGNEWWAPPRWLQRLQPASLIQPVCSAPGLVQQAGLHFAAQLRTLPDRVRSPWEQGRSSWLARTLCITPMVGTHDGP